MADSTAEAQISDPEVALCEREIVDAFLTRCFKRTTDPLELLKVLSDEREAFNRRIWKSHR